MAIDRRVKMMLPETAEYKRKAGRISKDIQHIIIRE